MAASPAAYQKGEPATRQFNVSNNCAVSCVPCVVRFRKYFHQCIHQTYPSQAAGWLAAIDAQFVEIQPDVAFAPHSKNPIDRRLTVAAYFLATISVLNNVALPYPEIRKLILQIAEELVRPKNSFQQLLKKLPVRLLDSWIGRALIRQLAKRVKETAHVSGFAARIITDKEETFGLGYGVDILECGICKLYTKHRLSEFTSLLCEVDHITSALAGLTLKRKGTIALGANLCDFRFERTR
ncbi:MAG: hypothetical protein E6Q41_03480 [Cyclobacteriaceae bacterium]|nr:MAG: hypothetical protein E6Q41_03480 [Cyclobacteriaceae bacterium]